MNDESDKQKTARKPGLISDRWYVIKRERKWWLIPLMARVKPEEQRDGREVPANRERISGTP